MEHLLRLEHIDDHERFGQALMSHVCLWIEFLEEEIECTRLLDPDSEEDAHFIELVGLLRRMKEIRKQAGDRATRLRNAWLEREHDRALRDGAERLADGKLDEQTP